jgi:polysaccharide export outer membrane protein
MRVLFLILLSISAAVAQTARRPVSEVGGANLPSQSVGPNDLIAVSVYDSPELSRTVRIGADGYFALPMVKRRIHADGLFAADLENAICEALREEEILVNPLVTVTIAEYHSRPISVSGSVKMPVVFQAEGPTTLLEALARAQGLTSEAGREILVSRSQPEADGKSILLTRRIPVRALLEDADSTLNVTLTGGEEIRVPEIGKIYVMGNVKKPGVFPVQAGFDTTVLEMLALAEGLAPFASKQAYIYRREGSGAKSEIAVPLENIMKRKATDVTLTANDILYIPDNSGRRVALATLERILSFGGSAGTALIYTKF